MQNSQFVPMSTSTLERLRSIRKSLLRLHKLLLDKECVAYQQAHGQVSKGRLYQLVIYDEWFAWLRPISKLIVKFDELFDADQPISQAYADNLIVQVKSLLKPNETGLGFGKKYFDALQSDPDIILTHAEVSRLAIASGH